MLKAIWTRTDLDMTPHKYEFTRTLFDETASDFNNPPVTPQCWEHREFTLVNTDVDMIVYRWVYLTTGYAAEVPGRYGKAGSGLTMTHFKYAEFVERAHAIGKVADSLELLFDRHDLFPSELENFVEVAAEAQFTLLAKLTNANLLTRRMCSRRAWDRGYIGLAREYRASMDTAYALWSMLNNYDNTDFEIAFLPVKA